MKIKIPTKVQCYQMIRQMRMRDHIVIHSLQVCRVATFLTEHLNKQHNRLNFGLIRSAALLHDITKTRSFKTRKIMPWPAASIWAITDIRKSEILSGNMLRWTNILLPGQFSKRKFSIMPINGFCMMKSSTLTDAWTISWKDMLRHWPIGSE